MTEWQTHQWVYLGWLYYLIVHSMLNMLKSNKTVHTLFRLGESNPGGGGGGSTPLYGLWEAIAPVHLIDSLIYRESIK